MCKEKQHNLKMYGFVTVGSTSFDELVLEACSQDVLQVLAENGMKRLVLQVGRGTLFPKLAEEVLNEVKGDSEAGHGTSTTNPPLHVEWFSYKPSLTSNISEASIVIGHAGAGTLLECCSLKKPLICVPNSSLLHGHQTELAEQMADEGRIRLCPSPPELSEVLRLHFREGLKVWLLDEREPGMFAAFLEDFMGVR